MTDSETTTIAIYRSDKDFLDSRKTHRNQPYYEVVHKLIEQLKEASA